MRLGRRFDVVAMPGNVMVFCRVEDRGRNRRDGGRHLEPTGRLVAGFQLERGREALTLERVRPLCESPVAPPALTWDCDQRWSVPVRHVDAIDHGR